MNPTVEAIGEHYCNPKAIERDLANAIAYRRECQQAAEAAADRVRLAQMDLTDAQLALRSAHGRVASILGVTE